MSTGNAINADSVGIVRYDGAGVFGADTVTLHAPVVGGASNALTSILLTNGQLLIGSTGVDPVASTLTAGTGVSIVNAAGSITLNAAGGGLTWSTQTTTPVTATVNSGIIANTSAATLVITLPSSAAIGDTVEVMGLSATQQWQVVRAGTGVIFFGNALATAISLTSTLPHDSVTLRCIIASGTNPTWQVVASIGNLTVA